MDNYFDQAFIGQKVNIIINIFYLCYNSIQLINESLYPIKIKGIEIKDNVFFAWLDLLNARLDHGDIVELPVLTGSMMPILIPGKNIRIEYTTWRNVRQGDIIVFRDNGNLTAHRLLLRIFIYGRGILYQKGDTNRFGNWIKQDQIVGVVCSAQNFDNQFISLVTPLSKKKAKRLAQKHLLYIFWNLFLIIPRKVKRCLKLVIGKSV